MRQRCVLTEIEKTVVVFTIYQESRADRFKMTVRFSTWDHLAC